MSLTPPIWVYLVPGQATTEVFGKAPALALSTTEVQWGDGTPCQWGDGTNEEWE